VTDIVETKLRKEKELEKLQQKMFFIKKDIEVTNMCIQMIEQETVLDIREQMHTKMIEEDDE